MPRTSAWSRAYGAEPLPIATPGPHATSPDARRAPDLHGGHPRDHAEGQNGSEDATGDERPLRPREASAGAPQGGARVLERSLRRPLSAVHDVARDAGGRR